MISGGLAGCADPDTAAAEPERPPIEGSQSNHANETGALGAMAALLAEIISSGKSPRGGQAGSGRRDGDGRSSAATSSRWGAIDPARGPALASFRKFVPRIQSDEAQARRDSQRQQAE
jgi:hypothetical protein